MAQVRIWIHAVWSTKRREPLMKNKNRRIDLFKHIKAYAKEKNIYLDFINGEAEHVHALISMACDQNIAQIMKLLKGESARWPKGYQKTQPKKRERWRGGYASCHPSFGFNPIFPAKSG